MIGYSNPATFDPSLTGADLMKFKYLFGTDFGRQSHMQVIVAFILPSHPQDTATHHRC
jgi:hypothetical protein